VREVAEKKTTQKESCVFFSVVAFCSGAVAICSGTVATNKGGPI
jgi:hypothetical protein